MQIFLFELVQNLKEIISDKQKKKNRGNVKSVCDQKRNSYGIYKNTLFSMCIHDTLQDVLVLFDKKQYFLHETGSQHF